MKILTLILLIFCAGTLGRCVVDGDDSSAKDSSSPYLARKRGEGYTWRCWACTFMASLLKTAYFTHRSQDCLAAIVTRVCIVFDIENSQVCQAISTQYRDEVLYVVGELLLNPNQFCGAIMQNCSDAFDPLHNNWTIPLPPKKESKRDVGRSSVKNPSSSTMRVLHISDIHYDPAYVAGTEADCGYPLCCRDRMNDEENGPKTIKRPAGKWGSAGRCDVPLVLLENLFQHLSENETFDYILWTGDIPPHEVWNQTKDDQLRIYSTLVDLLSKYFPDKLVFAAVGNHESAPADSFPPHFDSLPQKYSISWLYDALAEHWTRWIPKGSRSIIRSKASYSVVVYPGFRIISINTNYCMTTNFWLYLNDTDPDSELSWLVEELYEAEKANERVHIIGHTPPGDSNCLPQWSYNYYRIINRFNDTIDAQFFGHTHADQFSVFYEDANFKRTPTGMYFVAPSVTPFDSYMPAYRIYTIENGTDDSRRRVVDFETYFANLTEANERDRVDWKLEYKAKEAYDLKDLSPKSWSKLINRLIDNQTLTDIFVRHFYRSGNLEPCDRNCQSDIICQLRSARSHFPSLCSDFEPQQIKPSAKKPTPATEVSPPRPYSTVKPSWSPFVPKECRPRWWPSSTKKTTIGPSTKKTTVGPSTTKKTSRLINNKTKFEKKSAKMTNGNANCDQIKAECHNDECGQVCESLVAAHIRLGQPGQLPQCRDAVCHVDADCCDCPHM